MERSESVPDYITVPSDAAGVYTIWPGNGVPPGSEDWDWHEQSMEIPGPETEDTMVWNVVVPTLTVFKPSEGQANGTGIVIAPGGAFHFLMVNHEGHDMARRLTERGVTCFVLRYRLARCPDTPEEMLEFRGNLGERLPKTGPTDDRLPGSPLTDEPRLWADEDGRQAMCFMRQNAKKFGVDPNRLGIAGFSAGGSVALGPTFDHDVETRPDFAAPIYAAYSELPPVPEDAPPLFTVIADDDDLVPPLSALRLYEAWRAAGKSAEIHVFADGAHGFGMRQQGTRSDAWYGLFENWLEAQALI